MCCGAYFEKTRDAGHIKMRKKLLHCCSDRNESNGRIRFSNEDLRKWLGKIGLLLLLLAALPASAQNVGFAEVQALLDSAISARAELLSPKNYQSGLDAFTKVQKLTGSARSEQRIEEYLKVADNYLRKSIRVSGLMSASFPGLIAAHDSAQARNAEQYAPKTWKTALRAFENVVKKMEQDDLVNARIAAEEALPLLRQAELEAIQESILSTAKELISKAKAAGAPSLAEVTYRKAWEKLQETENFLAENRYEEEQAKIMAQEAAYHARHALYLSRWIQELKKDSDNWEKLILQFENYLSAVGSTLNQDTKFDQGLTLPQEAVLASIRSVLADRQRLQATLVERDTRIGKLEAEVERVRSESGKYAAELGAKRQEIEKQRQFEEKIAVVRALFKPQEGSVYLEGDKIILSLPGVHFASGSHEIGKGNFDLLQRVLQAVREFPERRIEVLGHTDSQGSERDNLELSRRRAESVRAFLASNLNLSVERIKAAGKGESQPIASNDTAEGRAANRRIEIILSP
jgi:outer membrane protein OmpA-like peptidoglycan-associated protein